MTFSFLLIIAFLVHRLPEVAGLRRIQDESTPPIEIRGWEGTSFPIALDKWSDVLAVPDNTCNESASGFVKVRAFPFSMLRSEPGLVTNRFRNFRYGCMLHNDEYCCPVGPHCCEPGQVRCGSSFCVDAGEPCTVCLEGGGHSFFGEPARVVLWEHVYTCGIVLH